MMGHCYPDPEDRPLLSARGGAAHDCSPFLTTMRNRSKRAFLWGALTALLPAVASAHATVDVGIALRAPATVAAGSPFVVTALMTDYAHDPALGTLVVFKFPPSIQQPKSFRNAVWNCAAVGGVFQCASESTPPGVTSIDLNLVAPATGGAIDIQASQQSLANFDPFGPNDTASVRVRVYNAAACSTQSAVTASPGDGIALAGGHVVLSWSPVAGVTGYRLFTAVEGAAPRILGETTSTSLAADVPIGATEWWVDALFDLCPTTSSNHAHFVSNGAPLQWSVADLAGQAGVSGHSDGPGAQATFENPSSLGVDVYGNILVADSGASTIRTIAPNGAVSTFAGQAGQTGAVDGTQSFSKMNHPEAIAVAPGGFGYFADSANDTIRQYFPTGDGIQTFIPAVATVAGSAGQSGSTDGQGPAARFNEPAGIAVTPDFTLYVSDTGANRIRKISSDGTVTSLTGSSTAGFSDGNATDARFNGPTGIAVDQSGNIFIADTENDVIRRLAADGSVVTIAGSPGMAGFSDGRGGAALFNQPTALALDASGNLYVADTGNDAIRQVAPSGLVTTMIGTGSAGHENGAGRAAMLNVPTGLAVDAAGRLIIADGGNHVVRVATPTAQPAPPVDNTPRPRRRAAQH
jgi:hypothetical protein